MVSALEIRSPVESEPPQLVGESGALDFDGVYEQHFPFVWRTLRRLGVDPHSMDDACQDVFLVVHRRLGDFEGRSSTRTWLFGIARRVARDCRRAARRQRVAGLELGRKDDAGASEAVADRRAPSPEAAAERAEAVRRLYAILDELDEAKREVLVLADLEQLPAPEIAQALELNVNTVYSRLRAARREFEQARQRIAARDAGLARRRKP